jgi:hypothetical protein
MRTTRAVLVALVLALVWSPIAIAKQYAPPGKAGTSEYAEDIPTAGGNSKTPAEGGGNKTSAQIDDLGAGKAGMRKLAELGTTGAAAAQLAQQTAPATLTRTSTSTAPSSRSTAPSSRSTAPSSRSTAPSSRKKTHNDVLAVAPQQQTLTAAGDSAIPALGRIIGGSDVGGIGIFLPLLLVFGLGAAAATTVLRSRRRPDANAANH